MSIIVVVVVGLLGMWLGVALSSRRLAAWREAMGVVVEERDRFNALLQAMGEGVVALDDTGKVVLANAAARTLLSLGPDALIGQRLAVLSLLSLIEGAAGGVASAAEVEVIDDVRLRRVLVRATPKAPSGGRPRGGVVLVVHDVTEIRRLETLRRDFVANVSHELRTPCSVILANAETLLSGALDDGARAQKFVEALHRNAEHLARLIADLLELSKIEAGKVTFVRVPLNLCEAATHVVEVIEPRARDKELSVVVDVDVDLQIEGDPKALDQVLINLIDNAVKYTPAGGHVRVSAHRQGNAARLCVEDDGPGVDSKHRARLFERFYRADPGRSRDVGGTGLGLAIVKHLVEAMDGDVGVEEALPHGTRFWVELPLFSATARPG
ncbi:MAG: ATP-binding protein [Deltaproteobacteria bacterium]|nr:ATP-binding protein [Deltaproteobacteria bacterium]